MDTEGIYEVVDKDVNLLELNYYKGCIPVIDFTFDYYVSQIVKDDAYYTYHISSTIIETDRLKCTDNSVLKNIRIWQSLGLSHIYQTLAKIGNDESIPVPKCLVIQDFDEACNIAYFENHNLTVKMMHSILRIVRKLSQYHNTTCIVS